ncbi:oxidoreductase [Salisediminibacterium beveridgei]|uniref:Quinone oxidoreductase n=1 Tax=Salisediminibacterium beveridgei TaxID=632773 RepID=A0A1D7QYW5_9BACI|nr:oxidoreductase [Salisediminibacterium beveridgei]AOM84204.1 quinone oxidoreductase [Salisediminibacterium beveridgei]
MTEQRFKAFVAKGDGTGDLEERATGELPAGEVLIRVAYSDVNYKDALALHPKSRVVSEYPAIPGIDLAGTVVASDDRRFDKGDQVICTSYTLGVGHDGGYSELARVPADWVVPMPEGLTAREAMLIGTAGFTAALSIHRMEQVGVTPDDGPILVTGATGGVGSMAIGMLKRKGFTVTASTGKLESEPYLRELGADDVIHRDTLIPEKPAHLKKMMWAGVVDATGGAPLAAILPAVKQNGAVALSGLTAGIEFSTSVMPFILRGVALLGVDSGFCPMNVREQIWQRTATDLYPEHLNNMLEEEVAMEELPRVMNRLLEGKAQGRTLVRIG